MPTPADKPTVLIDTREQRPFEFNADLLTAQRATLATGDYTLAGLEGRVAIERKSLGDMVGTLTRDWLRFRKELYRLAAFDVAFIVVECDVRDVWDHNYESEATPESVMGRVNGIFLDHGIPTVFWGPRPYCVPTVERLLLLTHKKLGA